MAYKCKKTKERVSLPSREDEGSNYRLYCLDTGFLAYQSLINMADFQSGKNTNMGVFFENFIVCELSSYGVGLFYWKGKNDAEFEFLVRKSNGVVPIGAKKKRGSLASTKGFENHNHSTLFVKVSENHYGFDESTKTLTVPLYSFFLFAKEIDNTLS